MQLQMCFICCVCALWALTSPVRAAENTKDRGGARTQSTATNDAGPTSDLSERGSEELREIESGERPNQKSWQLRATVEGHHLIRQHDLAPGRLPTSTGEGDAANRNVLYYLLGASWDVSTRDRLAVQWGVYQRFLADQGETGVRADDGTIAYTRLIPLPGDVMLRVQPRVDIGLSYESVKLASLIAAPRLGVSVERVFGPVNLYAGVYGYLFLERYNTTVGGAANPISNIGALAQATLQLPFLRALELGALGTASSTWFHQVRDDGSNALLRQTGTTSDPLVSSQPFSNAFGGEVFARYSLPPDVVAADVLVAYANGDPTIGYQALRHDGVGRFNFFYRHVAELYAAITVRY